MTAQASSTCVNTAQGVLLGFGAPIMSAYDQTALTETGTITVDFGQAITKGKLRVQSSAVNAATTCAIGAVTFTDGTNTVVVVSSLLSTTSAGQEFDRLLEFCVGIQATSCSFTVTLGGDTQAATINTEVFGNP